MSFWFITRRLISSASLHNPNFHENRERIKNEGILCFNPTIFITGKHEKG